MSSKSVNSELVVRWVAHAWALASTSLLMAFMFGGNESMRPTAMEALGLVLFPGGVILGFAIALRREGLGGAVTVASLALFYLWHFAKAGTFSIGPYFLLFAGPGFLHLANAAVGHLRRPLGRATA